MEALLEKIVQNTEPKSSLQIIVSNNKTRFRTRFNPPIQLDKNKQYEIALVNLETYYSFPNIDATNNYFRYSPDDGDTWFEMCIPEGSYDIININDTIQQKMRQNGHFDPTNIAISANSNTLKSVLILGNNYQVDFRHPNSISRVLGFYNDIYTLGFQESENVVNILSINIIIIIIRQPLCPVVGRRPQHAVSKLPCLVLSSAISCRSSICPGRLSIAWLVSLVVFSCHMVSNW